MRIQFLCILLLLVVVAGCGSGSRSVRVKDITKSETIVVKKRAGQGHIHALTVTGDGRIAGNAEISLLVGGKPYQTEKLSGAVTFRWDGDYYADEAEVRYKPTTVTGGSLRLTYQFHDI